MRNVVAVVLLVVAWLTAVAVGVQLATPTQSEAVSLAAEGPRLAPETSADPPAEATTVARQEQVQLRGCVIRFDRKDRMGRTLARKHVNRAHACLGVRSVRIDYRTGELVLTGSRGGAIVFISVSPDETLTAKGISCGPSGGLAVTRLRCFDRQGRKVPAYSPRLYSPRANLWIGWLTWQG